MRIESIEFPLLLDGVFHDLSGAEVSDAAVIVHATWERDGARIEGDSINVCVRDPDVLEDGQVLSLSGLCDRIGRAGVDRLWDEVLSRVAARDALDAGAEPRGRGGRHG